LRPAHVALDLGQLNADLHAQNASNAGGSLGMAVICFQTPPSWSIRSTWSISSVRPSREPRARYTATACSSSASAQRSPLRYVPAVSRRVSRNRSKMRVRPSYRWATGTVPLTSHTASPAITSNRARGSPPWKAAKTRSMPASASALKGRHRQAVPLELRVVELGGLALPRPDDCLPSRGDAVRERHSTARVAPAAPPPEGECDALD